MGELPGICCRIQQPRLRAFWGTPWTYPEITCQVPSFSMKGAELHFLF